MSLSTGQRLGPYEVIALLGEGGMGAVYRARDTRLGRTVALKVMQDDLHLDQAARARFEREARAAAALNHPHICAIHDVGVAHVDGQGEVQYLVLELLDGETLAARIARGPLPMEDALGVMREVLIALVTAHRAGLVHRDLKPANVMLTKAGVKLLDFGLAKAATPRTGAITDASTRAAEPLTGPTALVGTPHYMAPEQLEGREADARVDLWAAGVMLYEMLTGLRPFDGASTASLVGAILKDPAPAVSARRQLTPPALDHLVARTLAKDSDERWQTARDLLDAVERCTASAQGQRLATESSRRWPALLAASAAGAAAVALLTMQRTPTAATEPVPAPITIDLPRPLTFRVPGQVVGDQGLWLPSPDGEWLLGTESQGDGRTRLVARSLGSGVVKAFESTAGQVRAANAAWAPDSTAVAYFDAAIGAIRRLSIDTGQVATLANARDCRGTTWVDGHVICSDNAENTLGTRQVIADSTGAGRPLDGVPSSGNFLTPLGAGRFLVKRNQDTVLIGPGEDESTIVLPGGNSSVFVDGFLFYIRQGWLVAQRLDVDRRRLVGDYLPLVEGAYGDVATGPHVRASANVLTALVGNTSFQGVWVDRRGRRQVTPTANGPNGAFSARLFRERLLVTSIIDGASGNPDIWTIDLENGDRQRVFQSPATWDSHPRWSQDGTTVLFRSQLSLVLAPIRAGQARQRVIVPSIPGLERVDDWSRDGRTALVSVNSTARRFDLVSVDVATGTASTFVATDANESWASFSPDGRSIAYTSDATGASEVYLQSFPQGDPLRVSAAGGTLPRWSRDGRRLYYLTPNGWLMQVTVTRRNGGWDAALPEQVVEARGTEVIPSEDEQRFLVFDREPPPRSIAIVNWKSLLSSR